jgi:hypothetical protein
MILKKLYETNPENVSKVVNKNGEPLVVYHGTGEDFKIFQHSKIGSNTKNKGIFGNGFYATDRRSLAERYAKYNRPNGKVMSLFVNMRNPFRWSDPASVEIARKLGFPESRIKNGKLLPLVEERQILDFTAKNEASNATQRTTHGVHAAYVSPLDDTSSTLHSHHDSSPIGKVFLTFAKNAIGIKGNITNIKNVRCLVASHVQRFQTD